MADTTSAASDETTMKTPATQQTAEKLLHEVLGRYGKSACDTPHMLETLLRKHGRACPQEVDVLSAALRNGVVSDLRANGSGDKESLSRVLSISARVPPPQAEWAVATWTAALAAAPNAGVVPTDPSTAIQPGATSPLRAVLFLAAAAAIGAVVYLTFGP